MITVKGVDVPKTLQVEVIARFMEDDEFARFVELYKSSRKESFGGWAQAELPEKYYTWLDEYKSGVPLKTISNRAGVASARVYNAIKTAALRNAIA